jgi:hypothetical protein
VIFPSNLTTLYVHHCISSRTSLSNLVCLGSDLSNNSIETFEVRETDLAILSSLASFKMDALEQSDCPTSGATIETVDNVQICVVSGTASVLLVAMVFPSSCCARMTDYVFKTAYFRTESGKLSPTAF